MYIQSSLKRSGSAVLHSTPPEWPPSDLSPAETYTSAETFGYTTDLLLQVCPVPWLENWTPDNKRTVNVLKRPFKHSDNLKLLSKLYCVVNMKRPALIIMEYISMLVHCWWKKVLLVGGWFQPKLKILSSFIHLHVFPNMCNFVFSEKHILKNC